MNLDEKKVVIVCESHFATDGTGMKDIKVFCFDNIACRCLGIRGQNLPYIGPLGKSLYARGLSVLCSAFDRIFVLIARALIEILRVYREKHCRV